MSVPIAAYYFSRRKIWFDFLLSLLILWLVWPLFLIIGVLIWSKSGWPVFFIQKRTGQNGRAFAMYKFRTMYRGAERHQDKFRSLNQAPGPMFKIFDDPRFVGIGAFLSRTGLDELPQLINILRGEMSFVGPRPLPTKEASKLNENWNFRHQVKPGVFSLWTLAENRHSSLIDWRQLDIATVKQGSWLTDIKIIAQTLLKSLRT